MHFIVFSLQSNLIIKTGNGMGQSRAIFATESAAFTKQAKMILNVAVRRLAIPATTYSDGN